MDFEKLKLDYEKRFKARVHLPLGCLMDCLEFEEDAQKGGNERVVYILHEFDIEEIKLLMQISLRTERNILFEACKDNHYIVYNRN